MSLLTSANRHERMRDKTLRASRKFVSSENGFGWRRGSLADELPLVFHTEQAKESLSFGGQSAGGSL